MAEFLLKCKCGQMRMYKSYIRNLWIIKCNNCGAHVSAPKKEKAIELWNTWDFYHENKIHC